MQKERQRLNLSATLLAAPAISSLGTTSGPTVGGTSVVISGTEFGEVKGVAFGSNSASYTVDSEGQITAIAPATNASSVPVTVTTLAGTATSPQNYTFLAPTPPATSGSSTSDGPPPPAAPAGRPALAIAKPKPLALKVGKWTTVKLTVKNTGATGTGPGSLRVKAPKGVVIKPERQRLPALAPGASWAVSVRVELTSGAKPKSTLPLTAAASGVTASGSLVVKLKP